MSERHMDGRDNYDVQTELSAQVQQLRGQVRQLALELRWLEDREAALHHEVTRIGKRLEDIEDDRARTDH